ncbi:hypothetical protein Ddye_026002 [Dipteronia dyeriana]|uniref:Uncharacterized protein n=1 Tax=Dipteronia dyeriana TaxID=168575 RepID=A0AAD9WPZ5_9ROSI|nr:hypothetical protein Ddye_026002 [Dipteronia dyeriana]
MKDIRDRGQSWSCLKIAIRTRGFFHLKASVWKARNRIRGLRDDAGIWKDNDADIEGIISSYFTKLFTSSELAKDTILRILDNVESFIPSHLIPGLDASYNEEEVRRAVFNMNPLKAIGRDGACDIFLEIMGYCGKLCH